MAETEQNPEQQAIAATHTESPAEVATSPTGEAARLTPEEQTSAVTSAEDPVGTTASPAVPATLLPPEHWTASNTVSDASAPFMRARHHWRQPLVCLPHANRVPRLWTMMAMLTRHLGTT